MAACCCARGPRQKFAWSDGALNGGAESRLAVQDSRIFLESCIRAHSAGGRPNCTDCLTCLLVPPGPARRHRQRTKGGRVRRGARGGGGVERVNGSSKRPLPILPTLSKFSVPSSGRGKTLRLRQTKPVRVRVPIPRGCQSKHLITP